MTIDPTTGNISLQSGTVLSKETTRDAFLRSPEGLKASVLVKNEAWCSFKFAVPEESIVLAVFFKDELLESVQLCLTGSAYGSSWQDWSEEKEMERKRANDGLLFKNGLVPGEKYSWGTVWSGYDSKGGFSSAVLRYRNG